jgi:hypothetical protein
MYLSILYYTCTYGKTDDNAVMATFTILWPSIIRYTLDMYRLKTV